MKHETQFYDIDEGNALLICEGQYENSKLFFFTAPSSIHWKILETLQKKKKLGNNLF